MRRFQLEPMAPTLGGRLFRAYMVAFFLALVALSVLVAWAFPRQDRLAAERHRRLAGATAEVTETRVEKRVSRTRGTWWEVTVAYSFEVDGAQRLGFNSTFSSREADFAGESEALEYAARHPKGSRVTVWYDPADPGDSALDPSYEPVSFLVPYGLAVGAVSLWLALVIASRTRREARARPLPVSERRRGLRILAGLAALVAAVAFVLLAASGLPLAWHRWRQASLVESRVYLTGDLEVSYGPITPVVRYYFRPDPAQPVFVDGDAWRFGRRDVASEDEARAIVNRIGEDHRADRLVVYFDPGEPAHNALSKQYGALLTARTASLLGGALALALVAARRLRQAAARLDPGWQR